MPKVTLKNVSGGPKLINAMPMIRVEPDQITGPVEISDDELKALRNTEWFEEVKAEKPAPKPETKKQPNGKWSVVRGDDVLAADLPDESAAKAEIAKL